ncbi:MAG TPA: peptide MFS transporter [Blastocatellia bacterium]|nr:peptide MFS transporter [Blastocatellia bacterium]
MEKTIAGPETDVEISEAASGPKRHPRGLMTLFFTEMWERFSYYGMRALLILFLTAAVQEGGFGLTDATATAIYGLYTASVYLVGLPGGWIADRVMGQRNAVFLGGTIIALGHFSMALGAVFTFYLGLVLIVIGTGLLKPNVSAIVGDLYPEGGARRDAGFSIFYMGINLGAFIGPLLCGFLGEKINWHLGFAAAGVGMVLGLIQYRMGYKYLGDAGQMRDENAATRSRAIRSLIAGIALVAVVAGILALLQSAGTVNITPRGVAKSLGVIIPSLAVLYFIYQGFFGGFDTVERKRIGVIFVLFVAASLFWAGFEQAGSSMNLFAERLTNRVIFGWEMPTTWLQSVNPLFIIGFAPLVGSLWVALARRGKEPSIPAKFALGLIQLGAGFLVLAWASNYVGYSNGEVVKKVSPLWLVATYFLHTTGELCLSPVGLSSMTKLSPKKLVGQMMGIWFMASSFGNLIAGLVAGTMERVSLVELFGIVAGTVIGAGLLLLAISRPVRNLIGGVR